MIKQGVLRNESHKLAQSVFVSVRERERGRGGGVREKVRGGEREKE